MAHSTASQDILIESRLADAAQGNVEAYFQLGIAYSAGADGLEIDLVQAHKWFNLAALGGYEEGQLCRAEIADAMDTREIAEAQRQARAWLAATSLRAA